MVKKLAAECLGTFWLVFGGCGSAVLAANFAANLGPPAPGGSWGNVGIGFVGVALAFGLTVLTMAYAIGHISGCHLNPAVTVGLCTAGRFPRNEVVPYIIAQLVGGIAGAAVLLAIASGDPEFVLGPRGFACNGYGDHSQDSTACCPAWLPRSC
ncbi:MAG TPA: aquaporin [Gemmataceae bacterium]|nr:aquaporin [Gemmataceae bacterium]